MTNDPNSYKADKLTYKTTINYYRSVIDQLAKENELLHAELNSMLNSRTVRALRKVSKVAHHQLRKKTHSVPIKLSYNSHYEDDIDYSQKKYIPEVKALAFYLPQFHTFKENDKWWGKGFTEWTNTKKASSNIPGHYQPREPHEDIGYYTLDNADTIRKQVKLAKQHGLYGFCFYYYWFSGKRLLEKPLDIFLHNTDIDFPFCICWANENWTRTWDGLNQNILIEQKYQDKDPEMFIKDLKKYIDDPRYIRINGKPVIMIYAPDSIPKLEETISTWRNTARKIGIGEILIWTKNTIRDTKFKNIDYVDAEFEFPPTGSPLDNSIIEQNNFHSIFNYSDLVNRLKNEKIYYHHSPIKPFYYGCTLGWDNFARREKGYTILDNYSPEQFYTWLRLIIEETRRRLPENERFIFVNAWNEWAEGTYLEPDKKYGYTNINTFSKAIYGLPFNDNDNVVVIDHKIKIPKKSPGKIAIQIHAFYLDILPELLENIAKVPYSFDLYISTDSKEKEIQIKQILSNYKFNTKKTKISVIENIGRDVYPFLVQMSPVYQKYDFIGHFHTKKTLTQFYGDLWREHIYTNLLCSSSNIKRIFSLFNNTDIGLIMPTCFYAVGGGTILGINADNVNHLLEKIGLNTINPNSEVSFPVGTMFWARTKSIDDLFKLGIKKSDFPVEDNQVDGTIAHAIERFIGIAPKQKGFRTVEVINKVDNP